LISHRSVALDLNNMEIDLDEEEKAFDENGNFHIPKPNLKMDGYGLVT